MMPLTQALTSLVGSILLLAIMAAGLVLMFSPPLGRQMLKNAAIALLLFVVGCMLLQTVYAPGHP